MRKSASSLHQSSAHLSQRITVDQYIPMSSG
jgi:hypothetical protein